MTALSGVGAAFSAGGVCAIAVELKVKAPASAAIAIHDPHVRAIAVSLFDLVVGPVEAAIIAGVAAACKSEIGKIWPDRRSQTPAARPDVKRLTRGCGLRRYPRDAAGSMSRRGHMKTRRLAYWWFRFVASGRFLEKFFRLRRQ
jgi:hypothetical protein